MVLDAHTSACNVHNTRLNYYKQTVLNVCLFVRADAICPHCQFFIGFETVSWVKPVQSIDKLTQNVSKGMDYGRV